jgi:hypothetical protein
VVRRDLARGLLQFFDIFVGQEATRSSNCFAVLPNIARAAAIPRYAFVPARA